MYWTTASSDVPTGRPTLTTRRSKSSRPRGYQSTSLPMRPNPLIPSVRCTPMACGPPLCCSTRPILRHGPAPPGAFAGGHQGIIDVTVRTTPVPFDSDALRANIGRTAQKVVIPDRYAPLVEAVGGLYGVRASLTETMGEYFHTFRNADMLVEGLQTTLLRNWPYFERSEDRSSLFGLFAELVLGLLDSPLTAEQASLLLRGLLLWCTEALNGKHGAEYDDSLEMIGESLVRLLPEQPVAFLERDALLRDLVAQQRVAFEEGHRLFGQQTDQGLADHLEAVVVLGAVLSVQGLRAPQEKPAQQE